MPASPPANLAAPPAVGSGSFQGTLVPADVQARIVTLLIEQAAFANSITRLPTRSSTVAFPVAEPSGAAWLAELERIPLMSLNDSAVVVAVAKLAGLVDVANETMADSVFNLTDQFTVLLRDSLSRQLDEGLLFGQGAPEPQGVVAAAPAASGDDMLSAVLAARGAIGDAGGRATTLAASGAWFAAADNARDASSALLWPRGIADISGLEPVTVPGLDPPLVYDRDRVYCVVNGELSSVEMSTDYRFEYDAVTFRVKARVACAVPDPARAIRRLDVTGAGDGGTGDGGAGDATRAARPAAKGKTP